MCSVFAEGGLHLVVAGVAFLVDMEADDDLAAGALAEIGARVDEVLADVVLHQCPTADGHGRCGLRIQRQRREGDRHDDDELEGFEGFHSDIVLMMQN